MSCPADDHPERSSAKDNAAWERNVSVPWFTREPTAPEKATDDSPLGALERTTNESVTAADTVPVTDEGGVDPLMPVTAMLTLPAEDDSVGALKRGADAEEATYRRREESKESDTCHDVSWFDPVKKSTSTLTVSSA